MAAPRHICVTQTSCTRRARRESRYGLRHLFTAYGLLNSPPPLPRASTVKQLLSAAGHTRPGIQPLSDFQRWGRFLRCAWHINTYRAWFTDPADHALREALSHRPSIVACVARPYLHIGWSARRKLDVIREHYRLVTNRFQLLRFAPQNSIVLADVVVGSRDLSDPTVAPNVCNVAQVRLDQPGWFEHEGEVTISLFDGETRLYSLVFTVGLIDSGAVAYVGALQGLGHPEARAIYRRMTHRMHGLRPRDLLIAAFLLLCQSLGVKRVLAVSNKASVSRGRYFGSHRQVMSSYDEAWHENGGVLFNAADSEEPLAGFFEMNPGVSRRSPESIPARKRAQYRRRYVMLDSLSRQIADLVDIQQRLAHSPVRNQLKLAA